VGESQPAGWPVLYGQLSIFAASECGDSRTGMKKILIFAAVFLFIVVLTDLANRVPADGSPGTTFSLKAQKVVACSTHEIVLVDPHQKATRLDKDDSWPDCAVFESNKVQDFYLSRGEKTHFLGYEKTAWWRKAM
jgi:hypothetical protein